MVVDKISESAGLRNTMTICSRIEDHKSHYQYIMGRAVETFPDFVGHTSKNLAPDARGIIYLKGGELTEELKSFTNHVSVVGITAYFREGFFETKKIVYLPANLAVRKSR